MKKLHTALLIFLALNVCTWAHAQTGRVIYVDQSAQGVGDGASWQDAFLQLEDGIEDAGPGDQVWIAQGIYHPTATGDRHASFRIEESIGLFGGFLGTETQVDQRDRALYPTILSGQIGSPSSADNSIHVVEVECPDPSGVGLYSLEITGGYADATGLLDPDGMGAGLWLADSALRMVDCEFYGNHSFGYGAAFSLSDVSAGFIDDCMVRENSSTEGSTADASPLLGARFRIEGTTFRGNWSADGPGGLRAASTTVVGCTFEENISVSSTFHPSALFGWDLDVIDSTFIRNQGRKTVQAGGLWYGRNKSRILGCLFEENSGPVRVNVTALVDCLFLRNGPYGALSLDHDSSATRCEFLSNQSDGSSHDRGYGNESSPNGGAVNLGFYSSVDRCLFDGNITSGNGGAIVVDLGISNGIVSNSLFLQNSSKRHGGALFVLGDDVQILNNTIVENEAQGFGGGVYFETRWYCEALISGCILWGNSSSRSREFRSQLDEGSPIGTSWGGYDIQLEHSIVQGARGLPTVSDSDPVFVDPVNGDYRLDSSSPAIDALPNGLGVRLPSAMLDLDGNPRDDGNGIDLGAYEHQ